jgi:hypothetical protein
MVPADQALICIPVCIPEASDSLGFLPDRASSTGASPPQIRFQPDGSLPPTKLKIGRTTARPLPWPSHFGVNRGSFRGPPAWRSFVVCLCTTSSVRTHPPFRLSEPSTPGRTCASPVGYAVLGLAAQLGKYWDTVCPWLAGQCRQVLTSKWAGN